VSSGLVFDFYERVKLRLTGTDRVRFLNGQCTNDVRKANELVAIEACVLNTKGKLNGHVFISAREDCFFLDADPEQCETLGPRLERYIIADDVQIEDVTKQISMIHVLAAAKPQVDIAARIIEARRFNDLGWDIWTDSSQRESLLKILLAKFPLVNPDLAEVLRIEQGIPRWGRELTEEIIPIEANLESRTVDYEKGCYIGQEVISRMKISGQTNKRLRGLKSPQGESLATGMKLTQSGKEVGWITSATQRKNESIALGYVKRGANEVGTKLQVVVPEATKPTAVEIVPLPFR
jgi:folate-binding protein YgfZ